MIFYDVLLLFIALAYLPSLLRKKRGHLLERVGWRLPKRAPSHKKVIWIHAISLGETKSSKPLIKELKAKQPNSFIYLSCVTNTGYEEAKKIEEVDEVFILPFDFSWNMKRVVKRIQPDLLLFIETDFWLNLLRFVKRAKTSIFLVSGKVSEKSAERYKKVPFFTKKLFGYFDRILVQNDLYKERFTQMGLSHEKLLVTGSLKYDQKAQFLTKEELQKLKEKLSIQDDEHVITLASTHHPEEKELLSKLLTLSKVKILLAPRHPERFQEVADLLEKLKISFHKLSNLTSENRRVILIDRMGFLPEAYQLSKLAIVCGSYTEKVGGHNILEPNFYLIPVIFGPHMWGQKELKEIVLKAASGRQIPLDSLEKELQKLFENSSRLGKLSDAATELSASLSGTTEKIINSLG